MPWLFKDYDMADVLGLHFTLKNQDGDVLGCTRDKDGAPLLVLIGHGGILPALEREIKDMTVGQSKMVIITAACLLYTSPSPRD